MTVNRPAQSARASVRRRAAAEALEPRRLLAATVSGTVYHDLNARGDRGPDEPVLPGMTVYADLDGDAAPDAGEPQAQTDGNGNYTLTVEPGPLVLRVAPPAGYVASQPASGAYAFTMQPDGTGAGYVFGVYTTGAAVVTLFNDLDGDGQRGDNEPPLAGRVVYKEGSIYNDVFDAGEPSAVTDANGVARFDGLAPGGHAFRTVLPPGWSETSLQNDVPVSGGVLSAATLELSMGAWEPPNTVPISGTVYDDANASRRREAGEAGVEGWTVYLDADHDGTLDAGETTAATDAGGAYVLNVPAPGRNYVRVIVPDGWTRTATAGTRRDGAYYVPTAVGQPQGGLDFGAAHVPPASISGEIYNDLNANGARDPGEPLLGTGSASIDLDGNGVVGANEPLVAVDPTGHFTIPGLPPGTYVVKFGSGYVQTDPPLDDRGFAPGRTVTVAAGQDYTGVVFGAVSRAATATLMGEIRLDFNADGAPDGGILNNVVAYVDANNNGRLDPGEPSNRQFANAFVLQGLAPGTYTVRIVVPEGYRQTFPYPPGSGHTVTVAARDQLYTLNFSLAPANHPSVVAGTFYVDANGNGVRDANETPRTGTAWLDLDNDGVRDTGEPAASASPNGLWSLSVPGPGTYTVRAQKLTTETFTQPVGGAYTVTLGANDLAPGRDFGIITTVRLPDIYGSVFDDTDGDGVRDTGERAPAGRVVWLDADDDLEVDPGERTATQGNDGFAFSDVLPGTYTVRVVVPPGMRQTTPSPNRRGVVVTVAVNQAAGAQFGLAPALPDATPPTVSAEFVRSAAWSQPFLAALVAAGLGGDGYEFIRPSPGAPRPLPWANADTVVLRFSEDVHVQAGDLRVTGVRGGTFAVRTFHYDPVTATATWRLDRPFAADRILVELDGDAPDGVTDLAGNRLLGNLTAPGDYVRGFSTLPGDATGDGKVDAADVLTVRRRLATTPASRAVGNYAYNVFSDLDGNGRINAIDQWLVRQGLGRSLPPAPAPAAGPAPVRRVSTTRDLFSAAPVLSV
jgi:uncharacterized protein (DUF2141 family)